MLVKHGDLAGAIKLLDDLKISCENLYGEMSGPYADARGKYLDWATSAHEQLRNRFVDPELADQVFSARYWSIAHSMILDRVAQSVTLEIKAQTGRFMDLKHRLLQYSGIGERPGRLAMLDTNVMIQYLRMEQVRWAELVGERVVRLFVPALVLDEIDDKRYADSRRTRERARRATDPLDDREQQLRTDGFAEVVASVTVEYFIEPTWRRPLTNVDQEILDAAEFLAAAAGREVYLVTADRGFRVRVAARGSRIHPVLMPMEYSKDRAENGFESGPPDIV